MEREERMDVEKMQRVVQWMLKKWKRQKSFPRDKVRDQSRFFFVQLVRRITGIENRYPSVNSLQTYKKISVREQSSDVHT